MFMNKKRAYVTLVSLVLAVVLMIFSHAFIEWLLWGTREGAIWITDGHIEVSKTDYRSKGVLDPFEYLINTPNFEEIKKLDSQILAIMPQLVANGVLNFNDRTVPFIGYGVDNSSYRREFSKRFREDYYKVMDLLKSNKNVVALGERLASGLGAKPGDKVSLLVQTVSGGMNAIEAEVVGSYSTPVAAMDAITLYLPLKVMQELVRTNKIHRWKIFLNETIETERVEKLINNYLIKNSMDQESVNWLETNEFYRKSVTLMKNQLFVLRLIMIIIMILGISNIFMMNVFDRTKEIGTLKALGFKNIKILKLFVMEGFSWGVLGAGIGIIIGILLCEIISIIGIPMPPPPGMDKSFVAELIWNREILVGVSRVTILSTLLASFWPAWEASRKKIVVALGYK